MHRLLATNNSGVLLMQRVVLGAVIFPHGMQKLLGWWGGDGWAATMSSFHSMGIPPFVGALIILAESLGAVALVCGLLTRMAALLIVAMQLGAIFTTHLSNGFFMNWTGTQAGEGVEYALLALALAVPLFIWGGGRASLDRVLSLKPEWSRALPRGRAKAA